VKFRRRNKKPHHLICTTTSRQRKSGRFVHSLPFSWTVTASFFFHERFLVLEFLACTHSPCSLSPTSYQIFGSVIPSCVSCRKCKWHRSNCQLLYTTSSTIPPLSRLTWVKSLCKHCHMHIVTIINHTKIFLLQIMTLNVRNCLYWIQYQVQGFPSNATLYQ
jgi:hypothetical protein